MFTTRFNIVSSRLVSFRFVSKGRNGRGRGGGGKEEISYISSLSWLVSCIMRTYS